MTNTKGLIVCFDGPDGVGKTTQLKLAADTLRTEGYNVFTAKAVGGLPLTDVLENALKMSTDRPPETDLHVAVASQYALASEILPRRDRGEVVLIDRSPLSIVGYQIFADGIDKQMGYSAVKDLLDLIEPDLIIVYSTDAETFKSRWAHRNGDIKEDFFEKKPLSYHKKVAKGFDSAVKQFKAVQIDASAPIELVREATMQLIGEKLKA